jgi:hypothetical protein
LQLRLSQPRITHMLINTLRLGAIFLIIVVAPCATAAQTSAPMEVRARRATIAPKVDGVLDDEIWSGPALPLDRWVSYNPLRGERAERQTTVWIAYDDQAIYFAFHCIDNEPDKIRTTISRRDSVWNDDWIAISLDSSRAGQVAYHMFVNPSGIQMDGLNTGSNGEDMAPDWVWQSAGRVRNDGYAVEVRLPLQSIRFRGGPDVRMGVMFFRRISRLGVSWSWPEMLPGKWVFDAHVPLLLGELHQPRLLEVIPSATFSSNQLRSTSSIWEDAKSKRDFGASVKYGLTSSITLDATVNPDFSQVESDAFEVETNQRFPVFFSEKRPFFMEGLGLFNLAGTGGDATMRTAVHTRRIIDPSAGLKLTGTAGRHSFGILSSADASPEGSRQRAFTIGREVMNVGQGQYVGLLVTDTRFREEHNRVIGGDFVLKKGNNFQWNGSFLSSHSRGIGGEPRKGTASQAFYAYSTRRLTLVGQAEHYDRGFQMDTAFINRVGLTRGWQYQELQFYPDRPRYRWIKRLAPFFWVVGAKDRTQGGSEAFYLPGIRMNFTRSGGLRIDYGRGHETFAGRRFEIGRAFADAGVQPTRWFNMGASFSRGPAIFYDSEAPFQGDRTSAGLRLGFQPNSKLNNNLSYSFVTFEDRATRKKVYDVHIVNLRNAYQFTPQFFLRAVAQFDSSRERVLADFLASYELAPGTVVHAGYGSLFGRNHEEQEFDRYTATARAFFFKASYLARF